VNGGLLLGAAVLGLFLGGVYGVMASGLALTFGVMRVINVGHSALVICGAYLSYELFTRLNVDPFLGLLITVPFMFGLGMLLEIGFLRRIRQDREALSILTTWGIALVLEGVLGFFFGTDLVQITVSYGNSSFAVAGVRVTYIYLYGFIIAVVIMALLAALLYGTPFGAALRATTANRQAAQLLGINVDRVSAVAFGIGAAMAAVGGALYGMLNTFNPDSWYDLIGDLLIIVVIGGFSSIRGAFIAALLVIVVQEVMSVAISPTWADLAFYAILAVVLIVRPTGFFGVREREA
jgi:branched-chain amino acid transport system permease protein